MKRIKKCIMVILSLAIVLTGIYLFENPAKEVQAETQYNSDMLSLKFQRGQGDISNKIRVVASVDSPDYSAVGFEIAKDNAKATRFTINTKEYPLPRRIKSTVYNIDGTETRMDYSFSPKVIDTSSEYFLTGKWDATAGVKYTVRAWAKAFDGTMIYGQSRCITLDDLSATNYLNMSFELNKGCTLSMDGDTYADIKVSYNGKDTTAEVISVKESSVHVNVKNVDRTILPSATKFVFKNGESEECGSTIFRNLYTSYSEITEGETTTKSADTSWYDVYMKENEKEDAFVIATNADLYGLSVLADSTNKGTFEGKTIYLCSDIKANKGEATISGWNGTGDGNTSYLWTSIGSASYKFDGIFDGQGHSISGINVQTSSARGGLFNHIGANGIVGNFKLLNSYINSTGSYNGSIAGCVDGTIHDIYTEAIVKGKTGDGTGGIVGAITNNGMVEIKNCHFAGYVSSEGLRVAGIVGAQTGSAVAKITDCTVSGSVQSNNYWGGGLVGNVTAGKVTIARSAVTSEGQVQVSQTTGGLVGYVQGGEVTVDESQFAGTVNASWAVGGLVGRVAADATVVEIKNSSFEGTCNLTGSENAGGLVGLVENGTVSIQGSDSDGSVAATTKDGCYVGGLVGNVQNGEVIISGSSVSSAGQVTGAQSTGGLVGYAYGGTVIIDENSSFEGTVNVGWAAGGLVGRVNNASTVVKIKNSSFNGICNLTAVHSYGGYSYAGGFVGLVENGEVTMQNCDSDGFVTATNGYYVGGLVGHVATGTVTVKECSSVAATINAHKNGDGHSLAGGIIGNVSNGSISIENSCYGGTLTASGYYAGGLVGNVTAGTVTISGSSVSDAGQVTGSESSGGLVGYAQGGTVNINNNSSFEGTVNVGWAAGGLVGRVAGTVNFENASFEGKCNSTGSSYAGGLVGHVQSGTVSVKESISDGTITASGIYAGGLVGNVSAGTVTIGSSCFNGELTAKETAGGLVGYVQGGTVTIKDNSSFTGKVTANWAIGGLVGRVQKGTVNVQNSSFGKTGELLKCSTYTGGFVGLVYDAGNVSINNSSVEGKLEPGGAYVGGYIGSVGYVTNPPANKVTIKDCSSETDITASAKEGYSYASGIIGNVGGGTISIERSYYDGVLTAAGHYVGGIVGCITTTNTVDIKKCYAADTVKASGSNVGGIVGIIYNSDGGTITMEDCLNKASVESTGSWVGGLIGRQTVKVPTINLTRCLNMGTVKGAAYVGSIIGQKGDATMTATSVYATNTSTATGTENAHNNVAFGNNASPVTVSMVDLTKITVSNEVSADTIKSTILSGLFGADAIWTIGTTSGSTPELNLNQVK